MIASLAFVWGGEPYTATLTDDLTWEVSAGPSAEVIQLGLTALYNPRDHLSPSRGQPGYADAYDASVWLEASITGLAPLPRKDDGKIY
jgi:hypothetical protein